MLFEEYLSKMPALHQWASGWNQGGFDRGSLEKIRSLVNSLPRARVIETGSGNSTLTFLFTNAERVVSICPEKPLHNRIKEFAKTNGIGIDRLESVEGWSETILPPMAASPGNTFNFALIDGGHGWPTVFIDFFYLNQMLEKGGILLIDDVNIYSIRELAKLLALQASHLKLMGSVQPNGKCLIFEKITDKQRLPDWSELPYVMARNEAIKGRGSNDELDEALAQVK